MMTIFIVFLMRLSPPATRQRHVLYALCEKGSQFLWQISFFCCFFSQMDLGSSGDRQDELTTHRKKREIIRICFSDYGQRSSRCRVGDLNCVESTQNFAQLNLPHNIIQSAWCARLKFEKFSRAITITCVCALARESDSRHHSNNNFLLLKSTTTQQNTTSVTMASRGCKLPWQSANLFIFSTLTSIFQTSELSESLSLARFPFSHYTNFFPCFPLY